MTVVRAWNLETSSGPAASSGRPARPSTGRRSPGSGADRPDGGEASRLWNLAPRIPAEERYSRVHHGRGELIDHILASQTLLARTREVHVVHGGSPPSVTDDVSARRDAPASDHALPLTRLTS